MKHVVCISSACFEPFPTRKQNVMRRLPDSEIIYFDPPVTLLAPLKDRKAWTSLFAFRKDPRHPQENITVYAMPPVLPFFSRFRWINRINQHFLAHFVQKKMSVHGFSSPLLWTYLPASCDLIDKLPHTGLVYDCVDRHSAYGGLMNPAVVDTMERELAAKCDVVFATATGLAETLSEYNPETYLIPNGAHFELFSKAAEPLCCPEDLSRAVHPVFGFVGMLQDCLNYEFARALADALPESTLVFIGGKLPGVDLSALESRKNVLFLGLKRQDALPAYIAQFDVCLNIFRSGALAKDISPLKFYEYLATGKPIVSTPEPLQVQAYGELIHIAETPEEFVVKCQTATQEQSSELTRRRMAAGRAASWDARVGEMLQILTRLGLWEKGGDSVDGNKA